MVRFVRLISDSIQDERVDAKTFQVTPRLEMHAVLVEIAGSYFAVCTSLVGHDLVDAETKIFAANEEGAITDPNPLFAGKGSTPVMGFSKLETQTDLVIAHAQRRAAERTRQAAEPSRILKA